MKKFLNILILASLIISPLTGQANQYVSTGTGIVTGDTTATINGTVTDLVHYTPGTAWLAYGTTAQSFPNVFYVNPDATTGAVSQNISGLVAGGTYHFRLCGYFPHAECGNIKSFTTTVSGQPPVSSPGSTILISTIPVVNTETTDTSAILRGWGSPDSAGEKTTVYFRYSEMPIPPVFCNDIYGNNMVSTEDINLPTTSYFKQPIYDLTPDTIYYYCAIASSKKNIVYGSAVMSFQTLPCPGCDPSGIETKPVGALSKTSALLNGRYSTKEDATIWFEYGKNNEIYTGAEKIVGTVPVGKNSSGNPSFALTGLQANTIYRYKAVIKKSDGAKLYGDVVTFRTKSTISTNPCPPYLPNNPWHPVNVIADVVPDNVTRTINELTGIPFVGPYADPARVAGGYIIVNPPPRPLPGGFISMNPPPRPLPGGFIALTDEENPCPPENPPPRPGVFPQGPGPNIVTPGTGIPVDAIVRFQEGVEHVFVRQIIGIPAIARVYGYQPSLDLTQFANDLAHKLAQIFGYYEKKKEIRVLPPDIAAYELKLGTDGLLMVNEYYAGILISSRKINDGFKKPPTSYEYNYKGL